MKKVKKSENGERKRLCTSESKENDLEEEEVVIYTKEVKENKERKMKKYLPRLSVDLLGNLFASSTFLLRRRSTHRS